MDVLATGIFPTDAVTTITGGITSAISDNIAVVLGVLAFGVGLKYVLRLFNHSTKGRV
jgi:hypothetical protein